MARAAPARVPLTARIVAVLTVMVLVTVGCALLMYQGVLAADRVPDEAVERMGRLLLALIGCLVLTAIAAGMILIRTISVPIRNLASAARALGCGELDHPAVVTRRDELQQLAVELHGMAARLGELDRAKADFLSTISHELRTPLTSMRGYAELLADGDAGPLNEEQSRMLAILAGSIQRLSLLIEDLLTVSRIESGSLRLSVGTVPIGPLVATAQRALGVMQAGRDVRIDIDVPPGLRALRGDATQLGRVLLHLLSNAVRFTPQGGGVRLDVRRQGDAIAFTVADTGAGIPAEEQPQLFQPFFRSSTARRRAIQGAGLGLAIAKWIVEQHGGEISLRSKSGAGTEVTFAVPLAGPVLVPGPQGEPFPSPGVGAPLSRPAARHRPRSAP